MSALYALSAMLRNLPEAAEAFSQARCFIAPLPDNDPGMPTCLQFLLSTLDLYTPALPEAAPVTNGDSSTGVPQASVSEAARAASHRKNRALVRRSVTLLQDLANRSETLRGLLAWSPYAASSWTRAAPLLLSSAKEQSL